MSKLRKLPKAMAETVLSAGERNYIANAEKFKNMDFKMIYMMGYLHGFEGAWDTYTADAEEVLKEHDNK